MFIRGGLFRAKLLSSSFDLFEIGALKRNHTLYLIEHIRIGYRAHVLDGFTIHHLFHCQFHQFS